MRTAVREGSGGLYTGTWRPWLDHPPGSPEREEALVLDAIRCNVPAKWVHSHVGLTIVALAAVTRRMIAKGLIAPGTSYARMAHASSTYFKRKRS